MSDATVLGSFDGGNYSGDGIGNRSNGVAAAKTEAAAAAVVETWQWGVET